VWCRTTRVQSVICSILLTDIKSNRACDAVPEPRLKHAESTLTLEPDAEGTLATFDYRYVPRGGPLGQLAAPLIDKMLTGTFTDMLAATTRPPARMVASAEPPSFGAPASAAHGAVSAGHNLCRPRRVFDRRGPGAVGSCCR
jgi:hypothetical protein